MDDFWTAIISNAYFAGNKRGIIEYISSFIVCATGKITRLIIEVYCDVRLERTFYLPFFHHPFLQSGRVDYAHHVVGFYIIIVIVVIVVNVIWFFNCTATVQAIEP